MDENQLTHYGVLGMHWGIRKDNYTSGYIPKGKRKQERAAKKKEAAEKKQRLKELKKETTKRPKQMTDEELRKAINRLELEKKYKDLNSRQISEGKRLAADILKNSARNIGTQLGTYVMGKAINEAFRDIFGEDIVNPKKGQKDKK